VGNIASRFLAWFKNLPRDIINGLGDLGSDLLDWVSSAFKTMSNGLGNAGKDVIQFSKNYPTAAGC
jgi:hypothetical protein